MSRTVMIGFSVLQPQAVCTGRTLRPHTRPVHRNLRLVQHNSRHTSTTLKPGPPRSGYWWTWPNPIWSKHAFSFSKVRQPNRVPTPTPSPTWRNKRRPRTKCWPRRIQSGRCDPSTVVSGLAFGAVDASADADRWWDTLNRYPNSEASAKVRIRRGRHALRVAHDDDAANQWLMPVTQRNDILAAEANYWLGWCT